MVSAIACISKNNPSADSKRLMGWQYLYDPPIAKNMQYWTFSTDIRNV